MLQNHKERIEKSQIPHPPSFSNPSPLDIEMLQRQIINLKKELSDLKAQPDISERVREREYFRVKGLNNECKILQILAKPNQPLSFKHIKMLVEENAHIGYSASGLSGALKRLITSGYVAKWERGIYECTDLGKRIVQEVYAASKGSVLE